MKELKIAKRIEIVLFFICFFLILSSVRLVSAQELVEISQDESSNRMMLAGKNAVGKEKAMESSDTLVQFTEGEPLLVLGMTDDNWYIVTYQEQIVYVQQALLTLPDNQKGLEEEFNQMNDEGALVVEVVETYRSEAARSKIWGAIIISLVIGIFLAGIFSSSQNRKSAQIELAEKKTEERDNKAEIDQLTIINLDKEELE